MINKDKMEDKYQPKQKEEKKAEEASRVIYIVKPLAEEYPHLKRLLAEVK